LLKETPRRLLEGERAEEVVIRWDKVRGVGWIWKNLAVEFLNGRFRHVSVCVVGRCHAGESLHVVDPGVFAGFLPPDGEVVDNSVQQWRSGTSQAVRNGQSPPYHTRCRPERGMSLMSKLPCLKRINHFWAIRSAIVFSVDGKNVSGCLCSFGASIGLVNKVPKMLNFLNLTLQSFCPENFLPLVQIGN
jgi:hypothetical protein